jgi:hypothetical protein
MRCDSGIEYGSVSATPLQLPVPCQCADGPSIGNEEGGGGGGGGLGELSTCIQCGGEGSKKFVTHEHPVCKVPHARTLYGRGGGRGGRGERERQRLRTQAHWHRHRHRHRHRHTYT